MLGAIAGDIIGSVYERKGIKTTEFPLYRTNFSVEYDLYKRVKQPDGINIFTDDTVLTLAVAEAILEQKPYGECIRAYGRRYPRRGYGGMFKEWLTHDFDEPYHSYGNGSAMRVSPVGFAFDDLEQVLEEARKSAEVTHNHPAGIAGAQAVASAIFLARQGESKDHIRRYIEDTFDYDLQRSIEQIRPDYKFDVTCQGSVPEAILAFLEAADYEQAIRLAISLGGDADTQAAIAGGIAQAFFQKIPDKIVSNTQRILYENLWALVERFHQIYAISY